MTTVVPDQCSILLVDDMEENLVALEAVLGPLHQKLVRARSGEEALKAMLRQDFAVVLLDVVMPGMDGFETAGTIKRLDQTKDVPIILVTGANPEADYAYRGYAVGAADFLTKPIDPWMLRTKVGIFLDLYRKNQRLAATAQEPVSGERLADIAQQLARIELLLRNTPAPDPADIADRVAEVARSVDSLRGDGG
ncbi:response regulator [Streptomyces purpurogeneiscleroticus]|uniref:response regulator n=1 Tax=Streptomyces purpurogeneiscleroticus TaxID=68259 RepID=UPI001CBFC707|nr:response regulator [Streptomyces purpurogeneiscleroticus]MBZ4020632.1 response regulator [Streptomyces purpurogeneiscleroticus]